MNDGHQGVVARFFECDGDIGFVTQSMRGHPRMLQLVGPFDFSKSTVMGRPFQKPIKKAIWLYIKNEFLGGVPDVAGDFRVNPRIEGFLGRGRQGPFDFEL